MEELTRNITIGQYLPTGSAIHRMDPRAKIVGFIVLVLAASLNGSIIATLLTVALGFVLLRLGRIPVRYGLNGLRPVVPVMIIMLVVQTLFYVPPAGQVTWWRWGWMSLSPAGIHLTAVALLKFVAIVLIVSVFTLCTSLTEITRGVEQLLRPLSVIRFPAHEVALIVVITLRFVPTFALEAERLVKAQASRGAGIGTVRRWQVFRIIRSVTPMVVPLFVGALRRGEQLAIAMEARGYEPGRSRTSYTSLQFDRRDLMAVGACLLYCILVAVVPFPS